MLSYAARAVLIVAVAVSGAAAAAGGPGPQQGRGGAMMHDDHREDMLLFRALLDHRAEIARRVTVRPDGIDTVTESDNPAVAKMLQDHVHAMIARVEEARPIHQRDPLFREIFRHADKIEAQVERTPKGVRVVETSTDPYVVKLIQAHADVVNGFIANGHAEMMKNHEVPAR
jgi:hypothetical protein